MLVSYYTIESGDLFMSWASSLPKLNEVILSKDMKYIVKDVKFGFNVYYILVERKYI
ncbi:hypothetical protein BN863_28780 [Formosa agariphila KMM 3901]|uniref:Uncharacterized protein n=1 Tax=Formosa agariphila (strain DSM 15362 / KCTC 12365 / LMG 23005 / KMM 3901 / M-2Alg 35-1) TaxID=1347342 RepID=T2KPA3_FORAG|nr:hypothetical protein [Formosa agariphila]CDF80590.1 hypothetical protein BN863_28780 [Formosa agariphila KMM 3901]